MTDVVSIIQLVLELSILVASYMASKAVLQRLPFALKSQKKFSCTIPVKKQQEKHQEKQEKNDHIEDDMYVIFYTKTRIYIFWTFLVWSCLYLFYSGSDKHQNDDEVSIAFGEDADTFNERSFLTEQQHKQREQFPVEMDQ